MRLYLFSIIGLGNAVILVDDVGNPRMRRWIARRGERKRASSEALLFFRVKDIAIPLDLTRVKLAVEFSFSDSGHAFSKRREFCIS
jgi:hypothetical protein